MIRFRTCSIIFAAISQLFSAFANCQTFSDNELQEFIFDMTGSGSDSEPETHLYDLLAENFNNRINLNKASYIQLQELLILSDFQIIELLKHIKIYGPLHSHYELQTVPGFDKRTISNLLLFTEVEEKYMEMNKLTGNILGRTQYIIQRKSGFTWQEEDRRFKGPPMSILARLRLRKSNKYSFGFTLENDAGEPLRWAPDKRWYGPAFSSGFFQYRGQNTLNKLILGDFRATWGQGLVYGGGFSLGKGRNSTASQKYVSSGLIPYRSTAEQGFMRGLAITIKKNNLKFSTLASGLSFDTNLDENGLITSKNLTGLHRSSDEIQKRGNAYEKLLGANINYTSSKQNFNTGISIAYTQFDKKFNPTTIPENHFRFRGNTNILAGTYVDYRKKNYILFGEAAANDRDKTGFIAGVLASLSYQFETLLSIRNYNSGFTSYYSQNAFSESSLPQNENGIYWGLKFTQSKNLIISAYTDFFKFPWLKRQVSFPSSGNNYMVNIDYSPQDRVELKFYYKTQRKELNSPKQISSRQSITENSTEMIKTDIKFDISENVSCYSGLWFSSYKNLNSTPKANGNLVYSGVSYGGTNLSLNLRIILTDSRDYSTRFYMYEPDVLYAFNVPAFYGQNLRYYLLIKTKITKQITCWLKYGTTRYHDREQIGSGSDLIIGSIKSELKFQTIYKL